jgi:membrane-associated protease RseP (regulator of RpoE activity)
MRLLFAAALTSLALAPGSGGLSAQQGGPRNAAASERRGWIGLDAQFYESWRVGGERSAPIMVVLGVYPQSPAARAGLQSGDTIVRINGVQAAPDALERLIARLEPGSRLSVTYRRSGRELTVPVQAADRPSADLLLTLPEQLRLRVDSIQTLFAHYLDSTGRMAALGVGSPDHAERVIVFRLPDDDFSESVSTSVEGLLPPPLLAFDSARVRARSPAPPAPFEAATVRASRQLAGSESGEQRQGSNALRRAREAEALARGRPPAALGTEVEHARPLAPYIMGQDWIAGARLTALNAGLSGYFGVERGLLVVEVVSGMPVADAGITPGDVILRAGDRSVATLEELRAALGSSRGPGPLRLTVVRKGRPFQVSLRR